MNDLIYAAVFAIALVIALVGTPIARRVALHYNLLDFPDQRLKRQKTAVPYMGGVIVYFATITALSFFFPFDRELLAILFSSSILLLVGLFDDLKAMTPGIKFLFQIVATFILIKSGILINLVFIPRWLNLALTFFLILTFINAWNIIDILDGLATSIGAIACLTSFLIAFLSRNYVLAVLSAALAGALIGFLRYNWEPAKIYLGDAGSMILGQVIGCLAIMGSYTAHNDLAFVAGLLIMGIPLFDLIYVVVLRLEKRRSPFRGSPDHIALRLHKKLGGPVRRTVLVISGFQCLLSILVVANYFATPSFTIFSSAALLLIFLVLGWYLAQVRME